MKNKKQVLKDIKKCQIDEKNRIYIYFMFKRFGSCL